MGTLRLSYENTDGGDQRLSLADFGKFNSSLLGLGDISADGKYFEALAAIFDLEGFTSFTNQIDPHLVIPEFLNEFLSWLFQSISEEFKQNDDGDKVILWGELPFFAKFLGDGVLFLWDTRTLEHVEIGNIVVGMRNICSKYQSHFLAQIKKIVSRPPSKLRCGIARGQIISVGEGHDFVGPCINVASRLQKVGQFSFAFSKKGFNLKKDFDDSIADDFILIRFPIRGVGDEELIYVRKLEFNVLPNDQREKLLT
jgi:hypothetical protein